MIFSRTSDQPLHLAGDFHEITPYSSLQKDAKTSSSTRTSSSCPKRGVIFVLSPEICNLNRLDDYSSETKKKTVKARKEHQPLQQGSNFVSLQLGIPKTDLLRQPGWKHVQPAVLNSFSTWSHSPKRPEKSHRPTVLAQDHLTVQPALHTLANAETALGANERLWLR